LGNAKGASVTILIEVLLFKSAASARHEELNS
jgi:hypothetical protein